MAVSIIASIKAQFENEFPYAPNRFAIEEEFGPVGQVIGWTYEEFLSNCTSLVQPDSQDVMNNLSVLNPDDRVEQMIAVRSSRSSDPIVIDISNVVDETERTSGQSCIIMSNLDESVRRGEYQKGSQEVESVSRSPEEQSGSTGHSRSLRSRSGMIDKGSFFPLAASIALNDISRSPEDVSVSSSKNKSMSPAHKASIREQLLADESFESTSTVYNHLVEIKEEMEANIAALEEGGGYVNISRVSPAELEAAVLSKLTPDAAEAMTTGLNMEHIDLVGNASSNEAMTVRDIVRSSPVSLKIPSIGVNAEEGSFSKEISRVSRGRSTPLFTEQSHGRQLEEESSSSEKRNARVSSYSSSTGGISQPRGSSSSGTTSSKTASGARMSNQFVIMQYFPGAPRMGRLASSSASMLTSPSPSTHLDASGTSSLNKSSSNVSLSNLVALAAANSEIRQRQLTMPRNMMKNIEPVSIPDPDVKTCVPKSGNPFKHAIYDPTSHAPQSVDAGGKSMVDTLASIDQTRLVPPNQYSVTELRAFCPSLRIPRLRKQKLIEEIKKQLMAANMLK